ncbi:MAG: hypothetical protein ABS939_17610 [Psychrobacillus sp.]
MKCLRDIQDQESRILMWNREIEEDPTYSDWFYLHAIRTNSEVFPINADTKDYANTLLKTRYLISKCQSIIYSNSSQLKQASEYLLSILVDVVYLLQEVDKSLRNGVPLHHETIKDAVSTIYQLLDEKLNDYFQMNTESLTREIQIAKKLRVEYQARKESFK